LGVPYDVMTIPDGERAKSLRDRRGALSLHGPRRDAPRRRRRRRRRGVVTRRRRLRGLELPPWYRRHPCPDHAVRPGRRGDRRQDRSQSPEGKNLVGSFWQPLGVFCDTETLVSLPEREWRSGRGEMAKYAFLGVEDLDVLGLAEQVARCVACKAAIVVCDEREAGRRIVLNYGHTLAHCPRGPRVSRARTRSSADGVLSTASVGVGLVFAAEVARAHEFGSGRRSVERHRGVVAGYDPSVFSGLGSRCSSVHEPQRSRPVASIWCSTVPEGVELVGELRPEIVSKPGYSSSRPMTTADNPRLWPPPVVLLLSAEPRLLGERQPEIYGAATAR